MAKAGATLYQYGGFRVDKKGNIERIEEPFTCVAVCDNATRPEASADLECTMVYNRTVERFQVCVGSRWITVIMREGKE